MAMNVTRSRVQCHNTDSQMIDIMWQILNDLQDIFRDVKGADVIQWFRNLEILGTCIKFST